MSVVSLLGVKIVNNPAQFLAPYQFEITFECLEQLQKGDYPIFVFENWLYWLMLGVVRSRMEADLCWFCNLVS